jgi:ubiquinone biosynthesis protein UbiJ
MTKRDPEIDLNCRRVTMTKRATALTGAAVAFMVSLSNGSAGAGSDEQRMACERDAFAFCSNEIPDVDRIAACMIKNLERLSPPCRAQFRRPTKVPERTSGSHDVG